jgi:uncharacterized protein (DUF488 family)
MPDLIFTLGYQQRSLQEFVAIAKKAGVDVLIDVRETAWSHKPGFSKTAFQAALRRAGIDYVHAPFAGNPKWIRDTAANQAQCLEWYAWYLNEFDEILDAFERLVGDILAAKKVIAVACFERRSEECHRSVLAERWAARALRRKVAHLGTDSCQHFMYG